MTKVAIISDQTRNWNRLCSLCASLGDLHQYRAKNQISCAYLHASKATL